jgi:hypothetical protein
MNETTISIPPVDINWLAILAATALAMIIGSLWYGPFFGTKWMKLVGLKKKDTQDNWQIPMLAMLVMAFVQAFVVKHFIIYAAYFYPEYSNISVGIITSFWLWIGVALPLVISSNMFAQRAKELTYLEAGNQLITLLAIGTLLAAWS